MEPLNNSTNEITRAWKKQENLQLQQADLLCGKTPLFRTFPAMRKEMYLYAHE
jgi:hypothetical protein